MGDGPPLFVDSDVDTLANDFLHSPYAGRIYADWPLDRRLHAFLRRQGFSRGAGAGDLCNTILDRIMAHRGVKTAAGSQTTR